MIGIGITTTPNRKHLLGLCVKQIEKHTKGFKLHIYCDELGHGVSWSKNQNLRELKDCDHIFLFDDDCFPIKDGWVEFFVDKKCPHLMYLDNWGGIKRVEGENGIGVYSNCSGVMLYLTKEALENTGAFDEGFGRYGFEHADFSKRIYKSFGFEGGYRSPDGASEFIHALDYDGEFEGIEVTPSMTVGEVQKSLAVSYNHLKTERPTYIKLC